MRLIDLPDFTLGKHYRELSPAEGRRRYRFITLRHIRLHLADMPVAGTITFHDAHGRQWFQADRFGLLLAAGYAWNGCTPKKWIPGIGWIGTPDYHATRLASGFHDPLYQFHATRHFPFHRSDCDALFRDIIAAGGEEDIARIYHIGVRRFGSWSAEPRAGEYSTHHLP